MHTADELVEQLHKNRKITGQKITDILVENRLLSATELSQFSRESNAEGIDFNALGDFLRKKDRIADNEYARLLADSLGIPVIDLRHFDFDPQIVETLPNDLARAYQLMPLVSDDKRLIVAMRNPSDRVALETLGFLSNKLVEPVAASASDIDYAIHRFYGSEAEHDFLEDLKIMEEENEGEDEQQHEVNLAKERPTVRLVQHIILDAIISRASDIHIQPRDRNVELSFRIDGQLVSIRNFSKTLLNPIVSRIKIVAGANIAEHRLPQDGRARVRYQGEEVDLRISVMPTIHGESVVIRILDRSVSLRSLQQVGFSDRDANHFANLLRKNHGLILVTGPTGCGKSTTLYAALQELIGTGNIITVEDPVEYHVEGITQIQVKPAIGYNFARALRHILRHDPDIIMVGEIRDLETAKMAVESSLTGHIVLSTLHTNSAATTVTRLLEMGIEPYLVNTSLLAVLAQRLVRKNCTHCVSTETVSDLVREELGLSADEEFYRGAGCEHCFQTGYHGRMVVYELLSVDEKLRSLIAPGVGATEIEACARAGGMVRLDNMALNLARQHTTSLAEAYRVRLT